MKICKICNNEVDDKANENYSWSDKNILICPDCHSYVNNDLQILNAFIGDKKIFTTKSHFIDHKKYNHKEHILILQPYQIYYEDLINLINTANKLGLRVDIAGKNSHHNDCISILIKKNN